MTRDLYVNCEMLGLDMHIYSDKRKLCCVSMKFTLCFQKSVFLMCALKNQIL